MAKIAEFEESLIPATEVEIKVQLGVLVACMPIQKVEASGAAREGAKWDKYIERLAGVPNSVLITACNKWLDNNTFFPEINAILDLAKPIMQRRLATLNRLKALANYETVDGPTKEDLTQEERRAHIAQSLKRTTKDMNDV